MFTYDDGEGHFLALPLLLSFHFLKIYPFPTLFLRLSKFDLCFFEPLTPLVLTRAKRTSYERSSHIVIAALLHLIIFKLIPRPILGGGSV
jgi:hypothetical protein